MAQKEDVLLEYGVQRSFENSPSDMDMDFNDVFGGPPRRFSIQESRTRYSFNDTVESEEDSATSSRSSWAAGLVEKPVFGAETSNRRRNGNDFYDDIFKADESYSSPRRSDYKEPFGSNPGSRVLSPVRPLSPKIEPFGTSLPVQFSLPAKLTKATDVPLFVSGSNSPQKKREKELKNDASTFYRQSPLSREVTVSSDELSYMSESVDKNGESMEDLSDDYQFHFSIYKWAGKGVPILTPLKGGLHFKSYEKIKMERCSSTNGRIENDNMDISSPLGEKLNMSNDPNIDSSRTTSENQSYGISGETLSIPNSEPLQSVEDTAAVDGHSLRTKGVRERSQLRQKSGLFEGIQVENPKDSGETTKDKMKPLSEFLVNDNEQQGNAKIAQETEGKRNVKVSDNVKKVSDGVDKNLKKRDAEVSDNMQKTSSEAKRKGKRGLDKKTVVDRGVNSINKGSPLGSPLRSTENSTKAGIKGKVQDFVKMFNHEVHSTPREGASRSKSFRWKTSSNSGVESEKSFSVPSKASSSSGAEDEKNFSKPKASEKVQLPTVNKMHDPTQNVDQNLNNQEKTTKDSQTKAPTQTKGDQNLNKQEKTARDSQKKTPTSQAKDYPDQKAAPSANESKREDRKASVGNMDDLFGGNYVVEEIYEDQSKASQTNDNSADIQASDAKIRQWSQGRKGNIRSLLSTLQLVLWPESGWKPVALVDLIEGSSVKRSYQRALLYLHPDKLQQKGAAPHQKYIAEKVFDILQEAWDHFNSLGL